MARSCPACGRANDDDARFCQGCGATLAAPDGQTAVGAPPDLTTPPDVPPPAGVPTPSDFAAPAAAAAAAPPFAAGAPATPTAPAPPGPPASPPPGADPPAGGPPRRGKPAPKWLVTLIAVAAIALACVLIFVLFPRGGGNDEEPIGPTPTTGGTVGVSPLPRLGQYLAGAVGPKADRLAAITSDGTVEPITRFSGEQIWQIAYSPDGKWLACIAGTYKRSELWLFSVASGDARQATAETPGILAIDSVAWLSDGQLLVAGYTEPPKATGQNADLLVYDVGARSFAPLVDSGGLALRGVTVSASHDGDRVVFVTYTDRKTDQYGMASAKERLELLERGSGVVTQLGENEALFDVNARAFDEPLISPNGEAIIYRRAGSDVGTSYTVIAADGSTLMPARETQLPAGYAWDPAGTKVVFTGHSLKPAANASGIGPAIFWVFDTGAGSTTVLARYKDTMVQDLSWSPDGKTIAWAEYDQEKYQTGTVYLLPATGGDSKPLVQEALSPVWAPAAAGSLQMSPSP
jgi:Tol biopolymer transport system component